MESTVRIQNPNTGLRWTVLFTIVLNVAFSYLSDFLPGGRSMKEVSDEYYSLFTPAPFTFSIWAVIYTAFIIYGIAQLFPSERGKWIYDHLARPVMFIQVLGILWVMAFRYELMTTSYAIILMMLIGGIVAFGRVKRSMINPAYSRWITLPFSLFLGWISVAVIANTAIYLLYQGVQVGPENAAKFAAAMIGVAFLLSIIVSMVFRDWVFTLVAAWAFYGIYVANKGSNDALAELALIGSLALLLWSLAYGIYRSTRLQQFVNDYRHLQAGGASHTR